jgi:hypothetical protein
VSPARPVLRAALPAALAAALAAAVALAAPARAAPYAGLARGADATIRLKAADGRPWQLGLEVAYAVAATETSRYLVVRLSQCDAKHRCSYSRLWQQPLDLTELTPSPDGSTVALTTTVLGRRVAASWTNTTSEGSTALLVPGSAHVQWVDAYAANAEATFSGATCADKKATAYERIDVNGSGSPFSGGPAAPASWPKGFSATLRCA